MWGMSVNNNARCERDHSDCTDVYVMMLLPMVLIKEDYYLLCLYSEMPIVPEDRIKAARRWTNSNEDEMRGGGLLYASDTSSSSKLELAGSLNEPAGKYTHTSRHTHTHTHTHTLHPEGCQPVRGSFTSDTFILKINVNFLCQSLSDFCTSSSLSLFAGDGGGKYP